MYRTGNSVSPIQPPPFTPLNDREVGEERGGVERVEDPDVGFRVLIKDHPFTWGRGDDCSVSVFSLCKVNIVAN